MTKKMEKKYIPLAEFFRNTLQDEHILSYEAIENIMGQQLPNAAYLNKSWWTKTKSPLNHYLAWHEADFAVQDIQLGRQITFIRNNAQQTPYARKPSQYNITIRPLEALDARPYINLKTEIYAHAPFEYFEQEEFTMSVQLLKKYMTQWKVAGNSTVLLAIVDGVHAGFVEIFGKETSRQKHIATVRIGVLPAFQRQQIATVLLEKCQIWAKAHQITKLEGYVINDNVATLNLLEKFNFYVEGTRKHAVKINDEFYDEQLLSKILL